MTARTQILIFITPALFAAALSAQSPKDPAHHAFALYMGSGIYESGGQTAYVYRTTPSVTLRSSLLHSWGLVLRMPIAGAAVNYRYTDALSKGLPKQAASAAALAMFEFEHYRTSRHLIAPIIGAGAAGSFKHQTTHWISGAGLRNLFVFPLPQGDLRLLSLLFYTILHNTDGVAFDDLALMKSGVEFRCPTGRTLFRRPFDAGVFAVHYLFCPSVGALAQPLHSGRVRNELEIGVTIGAIEPVIIWGIRLPRVGISYRFSPDRPSVSLIAGENFPILTPKEHQAERSR